MRAASSPQQEEQACEDDGLARSLLVWRYRNNRLFVAIEPAHGMERVVKKKPIKIRQTRTSPESPGEKPNKPYHPLPLVPPRVILPHLTKMVRIFLRAGRLLMAECAVG
jgi:hypothetical protein